MADGPRVLVQTDRFRIVEETNGDKAVEKFEGVDRMGGERWRDLKFGEAEATARMLRDWIFAHLSRCPIVIADSPEGDKGESQQSE